MREIRKLKNLNEKLPGIKDFYKTAKKVVFYAAGTLITATYGVYSPTGNLRFHQKMGLHSCPSHNKDVIKFKESLMTNEGLVEKKLPAGKLPEVLQKDLKARKKALDNQAEARIISVKAKGIVHHILADALVKNHIKELHNECKNMFDSYELVSLEKRTEAKKMIDEACLKYHNAYEKALKEAIEKLIAKAKQIPSGKDSTKDQNNLKFTLLAYAKKFNDNPSEAYVNTDFEDAIDDPTDVGAPEITFDLDDLDYKRDDVFNRLVGEQRDEIYSRVLNWINVERFKNQLNPLTFERILYEDVQIINETYILEDFLDDSQNDVLTAGKELSKEENKASDKEDPTTEEAMLDSDREDSVIVTTLINDAPDEANNGASTVNEDNKALKNESSKSKEKSKEASKETKEDVKETSKEKSAEKKEASKSNSSKSKEKLNESSSAEETSSSNDVDSGSEEENMEDLTSKKGKKKDRCILS